jgi:hypothetical protein
MLDPFTAKSGLSFPVPSVPLASSGAPRGAPEGTDSPATVDEASWTADLTHPEVPVAYLVISVAGLLLALFLGWFRVESPANAAKEGRTATPLTILGIRVLDIESRPCVAVWLGSRAQRPPASQSADLRCLGSANGVTAFRVGSSTATVPASQVAITLK